MADYITINAWPWASATGIVAALATDGVAWVLDEEERLFETRMANFGPVPLSHVIRSWFQDEMGRLREENAIHEDHGPSRRLMDDGLAALIAANATARISVGPVTSPTTGRKGWRITWRPA